MDRSRRLLVQTVAKGLVFLLAWGLLLGEGFQALPLNNDAESLNRQVIRLYQQGKYIRKPFRSPRNCLLFRNKR